MLRIEAVKKGSPAEKSGLKKGDVIVSVDSNRVRDVIDFVYHGQGRVVCAEVRRGAREFCARFTRNGSGSLGVEFEYQKPITCSNKCVFCFVDQLPAGLRETLYVKDEDYRLSFLHGNFITMTNLGPSAIKRIVEQRLSPLYVSVHATSPSVRARLLGNSRAGSLLPKLRALKRDRIQVHAQIVLCPGINDGAELERTIRDLSALHPSVLSVSIVPVGLTRFRSGLPSLRPVDRKCSDEILRATSEWQRFFARKIGTRFVFAADELYLMSKVQVPPASSYEGFPQVENGVGLVRILLDNSGSIRRRLLARARGRPLVVLTGKLAEPICVRVFSCEGIRVKGVENSLFGRSITVSGLLGGKDILREMSNLNPGEVAVISASCLNEDELFLDGLDPDRLEKLSGHKLIIEGASNAGTHRGDRRAAKRGEVHAFQ